MDTTRFDALTRRLAAGTTRRAGLRAALGGLLGMGLATLPTREGEAKKKKKRSAACGAPCPSGQECQAGQCGCARPVCGGACCAGNQSCLGGQCTETGLRDCGSPKLSDGKDYSYCNLKGKSFSTRTLRNANFEGADLSGAKFTGQFQPWNCKFQGATMIGVEMNECDIKDKTSFRDATLRDAQFKDGHIAGARFDGADLTNASFRKTFVDDTWFENASLEGADLSDTTISRGGFSGARLVRTVFSYARVSDIAFDGVDFRSATLQGDVEWGEAQTTFQRCSLRNARFGGASLKASQWTDCDMSGADLSGCQLDGAGFDGTNLARADFSRAAFGMDLTVHVRGCDLRGATFVDATVGSNYFRNLAQLEIQNADMRQATFSWSWGMRDVAWASVDLTGAVGWSQPQGGYVYLCDVTLPDGAKAPNTTWFGGSQCPA